jgi:LuxR family maltose regulon positive regulatory protein
VGQTSQLFKPAPYDEAFEAAPGVSARLVEAGHLLGSVSIELTVREKGAAKVVVFSGDLGPRGKPLIRNAEALTRADLVVIESTYGGRDHKTLRESNQEALDVIKRTLDVKGKIFIMMPSTELLDTKLQRPSAPRHLVSRPRLIERLDQGAQGPLTLVCAGAGYGKTTLVSLWIEGFAGRGGDTPPLPAWLSLDESDSDLLLFLRYFVAAIRRVCPESCPETFRFWPQKLHLVLISRSSPPLPLAHLRAKSQVAEIRTRDLRFTSEEAAAFLERALRAPLSQSAIALLDQRLEGWIAGLRLLTLSLSADADAETELSGLSGTHAEIADYLVDDVLSSQTPAILRFLLATSILDRFCADLAECVLGGAVSGVAGSDRPPCDVHTCIQWLESHNLFVIPLDNCRQWYRYHHLFQELLQRRLLTDVGPEQVSELHRTAAAWFARQGFVDEALHHARAAGDLDLAARLMQAGLCDALNREDRATLDRWLRLLPEDFVERHPWLLMIKACTLQFSWQLPVVWRLLGQIEALLAERHLLRNEETEHAPLSGDLPDLPVLRGMIAVLRGQEAFARSRPDHAIACCKKAMALLPEEWGYGRGGAQLYWAMSMRASGRGAAAQRKLIDEYESLPRKSDAYAVRLLYAVGFNSLETGYLEQASQTAQVILEQAPPDRLLIRQGFAHYFLGVVHYCRNELDAATQHFEWLVDKRYAVHAQAARNGIIGLARVHASRTEISAAWQTMALLSQLDLERLGQESDDALSLRAQLAYLQGDTEAAFRWADAYTILAPEWKAHGSGSRETTQQG